ncbi:hypothetical protein BD779DRAFT_1802104 [Infundibulicybe gibba]|nr:hypothetical protein BD779DRAFT_1802104 [Infundibulicybe gibba]
MTLHPPKQTYAHKCGVILDALSRRLANINQAHTQHTATCLLGIPMVLIGTDAERGLWCFRLDLAGYVVKFHAAVAG